MTRWSFVNKTLGDEAMDDKKQFIMEKATELFAKQGFESTSIQQITEACGISKGAFYLSFKSKDELIMTLIDHFMMRFISKIDYIVTNTDKDRLLYTFYNTTCRYFYKHIHFAKIFLMELPTLSLNNEQLLMKLRSYDKCNERALLRMIERVYGESIEPFKYDLMYCIKHFIGMYAELFTHPSFHIDFQLLSQSLVDKTNTLAKHMTIPFMTKKLFSKLNDERIEQISKEKLLIMIHNQIENMNDSLEKDSLTLLKQELKSPSLHPALVKGLIENIRKHPHCTTIASLLDNYYETIM